MVHTRNYTARCNIVFLNRVCSVFNGAICWSMDFYRNYHHTCSNRIFSRSLDMGWLVLIAVAAIVLLLCFVGILSWEIIVAFCEQGYTLWVILFLLACVVIWLIVRDN